MKPLFNLPSKWSVLMLPIIAVIALIVLFSILAPESFFQSGTIAIVARQSAVLLVVGVGMTFVVLMGSIDLSVGAIVTLSGLVAASVAQSTFPGATMVAVIAGVLVGAFVGLINGILFAYIKVPSFLGTLGMGMVVEGVGLWLTNGTPVQIFNASFLSLGSGNLFAFPMIAVWAVLIWLVFSFVGARSRFGRYTYAIGGAEAVSKLAGLPLRRMKLYVLLLSGALAGIGGVLLSSYVGAATPGMGEQYTLNSIAAVVVGGTALTGGVGGVTRTILGVLVITIITVGLNSIGVQPFMQSIVQGAVVIVAVALTLDRSKLTVIK